MADINVQIKQRNGAIWDNLFPKTKAENVIESTNKKFVADSQITNWNNKQNALGFTPENIANKNQINGYAGLDSSGKIDAGQLPAIAITDTFIADNQSAMLSLTAETGDVAVRTDLNKSFILKAQPATTLSNWQELLTPTSPVQSVAGKTGAVILSKGDVGLNNVDNTSDLDKPVSTAQQTALNAKANTASPTFTGTPSAPTAAAGTNTTQLATTAFVQAAVSSASTGIVVSTTAPTSPNSGDFWYEVV